MSATNSKVISLVVLFVISLAVSLLPLRFQRVVTRRGAQVVLRFLSCAAGGIIFGTALLHLLPEVRESFDRYRKESGNEVEYPVTEVTVGFGFMLVFLLEQAVGACRGQRPRQNDAYGLRERQSRSESVATSEATTEEANDVSQQKVGGTHSISVRESEESSEQGHSHSHGLELLATNPGIKDYAFASALCLHALFEGLALGFLDTASHVSQLLIGVSLHKATIAITLVIQLVRSGVKWKVSAAIVIVFSLVTPIGIGIGTAVEASGATKSSSGTLAESVLQSIGTGTLLYVVVMGILLEEFGSGSRHFQKCLCFLGGYLLVAALAFIAEDHHHGDEHDGHGSNDDDHGCNATATASTVTAAP